MRFGLIAGAGGLIALFIFAGIWALSGDKTYEECMLNQMKGQTQTMWPTADKHCARRHRVEQSVSFDKDDWEWLGVENGVAQFRILKQSEEYTWTRMQVRFARNKCEEAKPDDFKSPLDGRVAGNLVSINTKNQFFETSPPLCVRLVNAWGVYK